MTKYPLLESIKKDIDRAQVISFDIFDTLLLRPYLQPSDLFFHLGALNNEPKFGMARIQAEKDARKRFSDREDILLDNIYEEIEDSFKYFKDLEIEHERRVLQPNPELVEVWNYALSNKKDIIVVSDMYLSQDILKSILTTKGFSGFHKLYVSGEIGKTKASGSLFDYILKDLSISKETVFHIGDNKRSDLKSPVSRGINSIRYQSVSRQFFKNNPQAKRFFRSTKCSLDGRIMLMVLALRLQKFEYKIDPSNYWEYLGYFYAGPIIYGYSRWIMRQAHDLGIKHLLFVARDGYTIQKVFQTFNEDINTQYVYAPRILNLLYRLDYNKFSKEQSKVIVDYYKAFDEEIKGLCLNSSLDKWESLHEFIKKNKSVFLKNSQADLENYKKYLLNLHSDTKSKLGVVDTITGAFSSQGLIQSCLETDTIGFYWSILKLNMYEGDAYNYRIFSSTEKINSSDINEYVNAFSKNWDLLEYLMTSPEPPVKGVTADGQPIYESAPENQEIQRNNNYPKISEYALEFAKDINYYFGNNDIFLKSKTLVQWINFYCDNPQKIDFKMMSNISYAPFSDHKVYLPLFCCKISLFAFIKNPIKSIKKLKKSKWRSFAQSFLVHITNPFKMKVKGVSSIQVNILPYLSNTYFVLSLKPVYKLRYQIIIGNKNNFLH